MVTGPWSREARDGPWSPFPFPLEGVLVRIRGVSPLDISMAQ